MDLFSFVSLCSLEIKKLMEKMQEYQTGMEQRWWRHLFSVFSSSSPKLILSTLSHDLPSLPTVCALIENIRLISVPLIGTQLMFIELLGE